VRAANLIKAIEAEADVARPGASVVAALRRGLTGAVPGSAADFKREFQVLGGLVAREAEAHGGVLMESVTDAERQRIEEIIASSGLEHWQRVRLQPLIERIWTSVPYRTAEILRRSEIPVTLTDQMVNKMLQMGGTRAGMLDINKQTKDTMFRIIEFGKDKGMGPRAVASLIEEFVPKGPWVNAGVRYRSVLIARSEMLAAQRYASLQMYKDTPVVKEVLAFDGEEDDVCANRNGETFTFQEAEEELANTHPNCVLGFAPVY
jgi:hypothetical protein